MSTHTIEDIYPLSPMQQGMLFHSLYAPDAAEYIEQTAYTIDGTLDVAAFTRAWQQILERHSILRTAFVWEELDEPLQVVQADVALPLDQLDWSQLAPEEQAHRLAALAEAEKRNGFDLAEAPLMRLTLIRLAPASWRLVWTHHHLLLDGWSVPQLLQELFALYQANAQGGHLALPPARPYRDYIAWLQTQDLVAAEAYWRDALAGFAAPTELSVKKAPAATGAATGYTYFRTPLASTTSAALDTLARRHGLTLNTLVQGAWALLLSRYSGEEDVVFGATVSGRPADLPGAETMIGLFINTLPVRVHIDPSQPAITWLQALQARQGELRQYEYTPLAQIQAWSELPGGTPLFESILVFENYPVDEAVREPVGDLQVAVTTSYSRTNYPLTIEASPGEGLTLGFAFDEAQFVEGAIERMAGHMGMLLEGIASNPEQPIGSLPLLTEAERHRLLVEWNATDAPFPADRCAHELFADQAARTPEATAVVIGEQALSYAELNRRANQLAHHLREHDIGPDTLVGICLERSLDMIVAILGVLKAGGAYLPLDPSYPRERLGFMLDDARPPILLTRSDLADRLGLDHLSSGPWAAPLHLDQDWPLIARLPADDPEPVAGPRDLAYVIYTSGSTGRPKGTLLEHRGLCNLAPAFAWATGLSTNDRVLQFFALGFDGSVADIFPTLLTGATLVLIPPALALPGPELATYLRTQAVSFAALPPAALMALAGEDLPVLRTVVSAGEALTSELVRRWATGRRLLNAYGPTEATVGATMALCDPEERRNPPIGRPLANFRLYVFDQTVEPVPIGVPAELYIGGVGVARGYLNRPELTAEKFIPDPFSAEPGARMYRTGDLVRYRPDGNLEFVGRTDHQVKIRGFRVELGEIETALRGHHAVRDALVLAREGAPGNLRLVAYYLAVDASADVAASAGELREELRRQLPEHMVPTAFVRLEAWPLSPSGKIDRRALPAPDLGQDASGQAYVAPRSAVEEILAGIYARVLGIARIGIHDDFFELGGHSILAVRALARIREALQVELPLRTLFECPTVAALATQVAAARSGELAPPIDPVARDGELPLSFAQQRLWFLDQLEPESALYNNPIALRLTGRLDAGALEQALNALVRRHETLRTSFVVVEGQPRQQIAAELTLPLPIIDLRALPSDKREQKLREHAAAEARRPFDLAAGPLLHVTLLRLADDEHALLLVLHHIISDGWTMGIFVRELVALYGEHSGGTQAELAALPIQYADYAAWQRAWLQGEPLERQLSYWTEQLRDVPPLLVLPTDRPRPAVQSSNGASYPFVIPPALSAALGELSRQEGVTLFMTILAGLQTLLHRYSGQDDICVGTPIANRTREELAGLIGFFVNTLVLRGRLADNPTFRDLLQQVRERALDAYAHQDLPFEMLVEALQPERNLSHTPLFQVMLAFDNTDDLANTPALPGLSVETLEAESGTARFDLTLELREGPDGLHGAFEYNTDLFDTATIARMAGHLQTLLEAAVADPELPVRSLPLLTPAELEQQLATWNSTAAPYPADQCAHWLFEQLAATQAAAPAVLFEATTLSYGELNSRANQLAHYLRRLGVGPGALVGICTDRSPEQIVAVLAVLKAGGAFIPLDPSYPAERLAFMITDSQVPVLLTLDRLLPHLPALASGDGPQPRLIRLDGDWEQIAREHDANPVHNTRADDLAYVIYTSGSTGRPKGAMLEHRGLCNLVEVQRRAFDIEPGSRVLQFSPFSFDASVWETVMALGNGAALVLADQETLASGPALLRLLHEQRVTTVTLPPSLLAVLDPAELPELVTVVAAGERCTREIVARWAPGRKFFNAYGPTETTVCASMHLCDPEDADDPPIGRPIDNFQLYILDQAGEPVPVGVPGELHIGGVGLARGYLNRPELSAEKFIADPFRATPGARMYRTGDLTRYRPDGSIEFVGRIDHQVKLRGFRIELGEIETALRGHPAVQDAVALVREDTPGNQRLAAYYLSTQPDEAPLASGDLRAFLRETLPEHMLPTVYVQLDAWPLSPSGKVDRAALPVPDGATHEQRQPYVAPRTPTEAALAEICAALLGVEQVGVDDDFFALGGHSLLATQLLWRVQEHLQVEVPLRALFEHPSVAGIAAFIEQHQGKAAPQTPAIERRSRGERRVRRSALVQEQGEDG